MEIILPLLVEFVVIICPNICYSVYLTLHIYYSLAMLYLDYLYSIGTMTLDFQLGQRIEAFRHDIF
jgi:hypothetical protein